MNFKWICNECQHEEEGYNDETEAEHSALEHMTWDHGYQIEAYYPDGSYAYRSFS